MATTSPNKTAGTPPSLDQRLTQIGTQSLMVALATLVLFTSVLGGFSLYHLQHSKMNELAQGLSRDGLATRALADPSQRHQLADFMQVAPGIRSGWLLDGQGRIVAIHPSDTCPFKPA